MRYILKNINNEPNTLREYREKTPNATYTGFGDTNQLLKKAIVQEQGLLCCYCMRPIQASKVSVEHFITQKHHVDSPHSKDYHKSQELNFMNMLGSCNDENRNCSGIRGNIPLSIDPRKTQIEAQILFRDNGFIAAANDNENIVNDLKTLKLGIEDKKPPPIEYLEFQLVKNRAKVIETVRLQLERKGRSKATLEKEIEKWQKANSEGQLREYCQVAIFYLRKKLRAMN
jgi:uncharacterized protein (TIGR02646 family)